MDASRIELRSGKDIAFDQLVNLYDSVGWKAYTVSQRKAELPVAIQNSTYVVSAWDGDHLIGLARVLSDEVSVFYLQDVLVLPGYQGQGIGTRLVKNCMERFSHVRLRVLLTDDGAVQQQFYKSLGFRNVKDLANTPMNAFVQIQGVDLD